MGSAPQGITPRPPAVATVRANGDSWLDFTLAKRIPGIRANFGDVSRGMTREFTAGVIATLLLRAVLRLACGGIGAATTSSVARLRAGEGGGGLL